MNAYYKVFPFRLKKYRSVVDKNPVEMLTLKNLTFTTKIKDTNNTFVITIIENVNDIF